MNFYRRKRALNLHLVVLLIAIFCCFLLILCGRSVSHAAQEELNVQTSNTVYVVNPVYSGLVTEADLNRGNESSIDPKALMEAVKCKTQEEMALSLKSQMMDRNDTASVYFELPGTDYSAKSLMKIEEQVLNMAVVHTGVGNEGDYLKWGYSGLGMQISYGKSTGDTIGCFSYYFTYYTNAEKEKKVTSKVKSIATSLSLDGKKDYEKISKVYDYVVSNVKYNYGNDNIKYSCYAAAVNNSAVCQGYSLLIYRLLNDAGVDCRLIAGNTSSGAHGWNIVRLNDVYYNLDSTWDAGKKSSKYDYFMKCNKNFKGHTRWNEYSSPEFNAAYPMSNSDYTVDALESGDVESIKLKKDALTLSVGETCELKVTTKPSVSIEKLKLKSSNKKVASVDSKGIVTAKKAGTCTITVSSSNGKVSKKCYVTVVKPKNTAVSSVKFSKKTVKLSPGKTVKLTVVINPSDAADRKVKFKSSNKKVATVDKNGKVKAKKKGTAIITVTTKDGKKTAKCKVVVK